MLEPPPPGLILAEVCTPRLFVAWLESGPFLEGAIYQWRPPLFEEALWQYLHREMSRVYTVHALSAPHLARGILAMDYERGGMEGSYGPGARHIVLPLPVWCVTALQGIHGLLPLSQLAHLLRLSLPAYFSDRTE